MSVSIETQLLTERDRYRDYLVYEHEHCHNCHGDGSYERINPDGYRVRGECVNCRGLRKVLGLPLFGKDKRVEKGKCRGKPR